MNKGHFKSGEKHPRWNNGIYLKTDGRCMIKVPNHPKAGKRGYVMKSVLVAEKALGKYLPDRVVIHHVDNNHTDDRPNNLVVCQDQSYHKLLHIREKALRESGNPNKRRCKRCKKWDSMDKLKRYGEETVHPKCAALHTKRTREGNANQDR